MDTAVIQANNFGAPNINGSFSVGTLNMNGTITTAGALATPIASAGSTTSSLTIGTLNFVSGTGFNYLALRSQAPFNVALGLSVNQVNLATAGSLYLGMADVAGRYLTSLNIAQGVTFSGGASGNSLTSSSVSYSNAQFLYVNVASGGTANLGLITYGGSYANTYLYAGNEGSSDTVTVSGLNDSTAGNTNNIIYGVTSARLGDPHTTLNINNTSGTVYSSNVSLQDSSGSRGDLSVALTAGAQTLSGSNTYTGQTTVNGGTLKTTSSTGLGYGGIITTGKSVNGTVVNAAGTLDLGGQTVNEPLTLNGGILSNSGSGTAKISNGLAAIAATSSVSNLSAVPTVTISGGGGTGATAAAFLAMSSTSVTIAGGGSGYAVGDVLTLNGGSSVSQAVYQVASVSGGAITGLTLIDGGVYTATTAATGFTAKTGSGSGATITFNGSAFALGGVKMVTAGSGYTSAPTVTLSGSAGTATASVGNVQLTADSTMSTNTGLEVDSQVVGAGKLTKTGSGLLTLAASANTYSGGTLVSAGTLSALSLGAGDVTVASLATLTLTGNTAIADTASLILGSSSLLNLNFTGTETVNLLSLDGGTTYVSGGTWGGLSSGATYQSALLNGTGLLMVAVPEPASWLLALAGGLMLVVAGRRARKSFSASL